MGTIVPPGTCPALPPGHLWVIRTWQALILNTKFNFFLICTLRSSIEWFSLKFPALVVCSNQIDSSHVNEEFVHSQYICILTSQVSTPFLLPTKLLIVLITLSILCVLYFLFLHCLFNLEKCEKSSFSLLYLTLVTSCIIGPFLCCHLLYLIIYLVVAIKYNQASAKYKFSELKETRIERPNEYPEEFNTTTTTTTTMEPISPLYHEDESVNNQTKHFQILTRKKKRLELLVTGDCLDLVPIGELRIVW